MQGTDAHGDTVARLTAENERLRRQLEAPSPVGRRARAFLATVLIALGVVLAPVSLIAFWTRSEVTNTDRFVATVGPLIADPELQSFLVDQIVEVIDESADLEGTASELFDGLATLGLPPRAAIALGLLEGPAVAGVRSVIRSTTATVVASDAFAQVWSQSIRLSHDQLVGALRGDADSAVVVGPGGEVGIALGPIVAEVKTRLLAQGFRLAERIPAVERTIPLAQADALVNARGYYQLLDVLGFVLPWACVVLVAAGVLAARRRARALIVAGLGLAAAMALFTVGVYVGRSYFTVSVSPDLPAGAARTIYDAIVAFVSSAAVSLGLLGALVALVTYLAGPFRSARTLRRVTRDAVGRVRVLAGRGRGGGSRDSSSSASKRDSESDAVPQRTGHDET
jgi:hypothetical protein